MGDFTPWTDWIMNVERLQGERPGENGREKHNLCGWRRVATIILADAGERWNWFFGCRGLDSFV